MLRRTPLTLLLAAGCSGSLTIDATQGDSHSGTSRSTGDSDTSQATDTAAPTDTTPTGGADASESRGDSEVGGQSDSNSGSDTTAATQTTGESGTGQIADTSGTSEDGTSGTPEDGTSGTSATTGGSSSTSEPIDNSTETEQEPELCPGNAGPEPVYLGSADDLATPGSYVLLAKTGVTNVTGSAIVGGNLGVSPVAASYITGFSMVLDPSSVHSTSISVVAPGKIYAADYALPTPSNLNKAVLEMQAAYTDAAGRILPDHLNLNSGDIGGLTLEPGLYTWGSTVIIPNDVTLAGCPEDVWIFQISNDLDLSAAKSVILTGGAQARNVFWQIAGQATIHANAHFEGILLSKTGITLQTAASMHGRALAQTLIALDNNAVTAP